MAKWVAWRIRRVHMSVIGCVSMPRWPAAGLPPLDGQKQESGNESPAGLPRNRRIERKIPFPASGGRNRNRATESDKARIGRTESDRVGRNGSWVRNPARRLSAWKGDGQNQIE